MERIEEYRRIIQKILEAFTNVPFTVVVESATGKTINPVNLNDPKDRELIDDLKTIADNILTEFFEKSITLGEYRKLGKKSAKTFRPNEVSVFLEHTFPKKFMEIKESLKTIVNVVHLKESGYPDEKIIDKYGRVTFLEIKATTRPDSGSPRDFFFTPLGNTKKKVDSDGHHLLLGFVIEEARPKTFRTIGWKLVDLSKIFVSMKPEFNTDNRELYKRGAVITENWIDS